MRQIGDRVSEATLLRGFSSESSMVKELGIQGKVRLLHLLK